MIATGFDEKGRATGGTIWKRESYEKESSEVSELPIDIENILKDLEED